MAELTKFILLIFLYDCVFSRSSFLITYLNLSFLLSRSVPSCESVIAWSVLCSLVKCCSCGVNSTVKNILSDYFCSVLKEKPHTRSCLCVTSLSFVIINNKKILKTTINSYLTGLQKFFLTDLSSQKVASSWGGSFLNLEQYFFLLSGWTLHSSSLKASIWLQNIKESLCTVSAVKKKKLTTNFPGVRKNGWRKN